MARTNIGSGKVNGGLSRVAKEDWQRRVAALAVLPQGKRFVSHPVVDGKINGVPVNEVAAVAMRKGQTVRAYKGQLQIAAA